MSGALMDGVDLEGGSLRRADVFGVSLHGANLRDVSMERARIHTSRLMGSCLDGAKMDGVQILESDFAGSSMEEVLLTNARVRGYFCGSGLQRACLDGTDFNGSVFVGVDLLGAKMDNVHNMNVTRPLVRTRPMSFVEAVKATNPEIFEEHGFKLKAPPVQAEEPSAELSAQKCRELLLALDPKKLEGELAAASSRIKEFYELLDKIETKKLDDLKREIKV